MEFLTFDVTSYGYKWLKFLELHLDWKTARVPIIARHALVATVPPLWIQLWSVHALIIFLQMENL